MLEIVTSKWPDFLINILGVIIGGIITIKVARWQVNRQNEELKLREEEMLAVYFPRVFLEFRDNLLTIRMLEEVLTQSESAGVNIWVWANSVVESFSLSAYDDMLKQGLQRYLPRGIEKHLFHSNRMIVNLNNMIKQGLVKHQFYGYKADENSANVVLKNSLTYCRTVKKHFESVMEPLEKYKENLDIQMKKEQSE